MAERKGGVKNMLCEINVNKAKEIDETDQIDLSREMPFRYLTGTRQTE